MNLQNKLCFRDFNILPFPSLTRSLREEVRCMRNHPEVRKWMYQKHEITKKEHATFIKSLKTDRHNGYWLVKNKNGCRVGVIGLHRLDLKNKNAYLGIYANPLERFSGQGAILMDCLKYLAFSKLRLHSLKLEVIASNKHALRFYRKAGFVREGQLKEFVLVDGKWCDVCVMGIINGNKNR